MIWEKYKSKIISTTVIFLILAFAFSFFFLISPRTAAFNYEGNAEWVSFNVNASERKTFQFNFLSDPDNGRIEFKSDPSEMIYAVELGLAPDPAMGLEDFEWELYEDKKVFPFQDGSATLDSGGPISLTITLPDDKEPSFTMAIKNTESDLGDGWKNQILIGNFPEDTYITVSSDEYLQMKGDTSGTQLAGGYYRIYGCTAISFYLSPPVSDSLENQTELDLSFATEISDFTVQNSGRQTIELTIDAETEFREIGHVKFDGQAKQADSVSLQISDLSEYPLSITLTGEVGPFHIAGQSVYTTIWQWLRENRTQILLALIGVIFSTIIVRPAPPAHESRDLPENKKLSK